MRHKFSILLLINLAFLSCNSQTSDIKNSFDSVNKSITKANAVFEKSFEEVYLSIRRNSNNATPLVSASAKIYLATKTAIDFIDSLKTVLSEKDSTGEDHTISEKLLVNTKTGDDLTRSLTNVYNSTRSNVFDTSRKRQLNTTQMTLKIISNDQAWTKLYFENAPTVSAVTILNKLQIDCELSAVQALMDISERLK